MSNNTTTTPFVLTQPASHGPLLIPLGNTCQMTVPQRVGHHHREELVSTKKDRTLQNCAPGHSERTPEARSSSQEGCVMG